MAELPDVSGTSMKVLSPRQSVVVEVIFSSFFAHTLLYFPASGQAVVTGVTTPSSPRFLPSTFIAHRVQQSQCSSIFHRVYELSVTNRSLKGKSVWSQGETCEDLHGEADEGICLLASQGPHIGYICSTPQVFIMTDLRRTDTTEFRRRLCVPRRESKSLVQVLKM